MVFILLSSGFHELTHELRDGVHWRHPSDENKRRLVALPQMFSTSAAMEEDNLNSLTERYHKYKREYVKHITFNPEKESLGKYMLEFIIFIHFQCL